jgi:hypothetical protein
MIGRSERGERLEKLDSTVVAINSEGKLRMKQSRANEGDVSPPVF